jgi:alkylation response protein AidB-like acyl-CoA dehydrogenase
MAADVPHLHEVPDVGWPMDVALSSEQHLLRETAREFFAARSSLPAGRAALDGDLAGVRDLRAEMGGLGLLGMLAGDNNGWTAGTVLDLVVVAEEAGRALVSSPLVATAAHAVSLLEQAATDGSAAAERLLAEVVTGRLPVTVVSPGLLHLAGTSLTGHSAPAVDARGARTLLTVIGDTLLAVEVGPEVTLECRLPTDPSRGLALLHFRRAPVHQLHRGVRVHAASERATQIAGVVLAAEALGTIGEALRRVVEQARGRLGSGRPTGTLGTAQEALVDSLVLQERLRSLLWLTAHIADRAPTDLPAYADAVAACASDAVDSAMRTLIQVHDGIDPTWDLDAHLLWRRAVTDRTLLGDAWEQRDRLDTLLTSGRTRLRMFPSGSA